MKENPSRSYWKEREEQVRKERAKREKGYQEEIKEIYEDMLDTVLSFRGLFMKNGDGQKRG